MIAQVLILAAAASQAQALKVNCADRVCVVSGQRLSFYVEQIGENLVLRPAAIVADREPYRNKKIDARQFQIIPDFCVKQNRACHYLFGPHIDVIRWYQREDKAFKVSTRRALREIEPARTLKVSVSFLEGRDVIGGTFVNVDTAAFLASVARADRILARSRSQATN